MWMFIVSIALLLAVALVISLPLLRGALVPYALEAEPGQPEEDFSERDALLDALSDLEDSFGAGKLTRPDYEAQKERLQLRYVEVVDGRASSS